MTVAVTPGPPEPKPALRAFCFSGEGGYMKVLYNREGKCYNNKLMKLTGGEIDLRK